MKILWGAAGILALTVLLDLYVSNNVPVVTRLEVSLARLPQAFSGFRAAVLSDMHAKSFGEGNQTLLRLLEKEKPDIIALTGDVVDHEGQLDWLDTQLAALTAIAPVFYVTGNHEWGGERKAVKGGHEKLIPRIKALVESHGAVWLDNDCRVLERDDAYIVVAGLMDPNGPADQIASAPVVEKIRAVYDDPFILTLSHRYDRLDEYADLNLDLVLCGHAHGGVIRLPFIGGLFGPGQVLLPNNTEGLVYQNNTVMAVSRGLGDTALPRLGNRPELLVLTLKTCLQ